MKVCILGNARSGTTAIYVLLQEIMSGNHQNTQFAYEPFLWDKPVFNDKFSRVTGNFAYWDSTSVDGMYQHQKLPILIQSDTECLHNDYLDQILEVDKPANDLLAKFIRANGRIRLLHKTCPGMKFLFTIRNPIDSVNSVLTKFSYYGGEFHHDDFPRLIDAVNSAYRLNFTKDQFKNQVEKELFYWYYMNKFALETLSQISGESLVISHESFSANIHSTVEQICKFLDYKMEESYCSTAEVRVGDLTKKREISAAELEFILPYWEKYEQLLDEFNIPSPITREDVLKKYVVTDDGVFRNSKYYGMIPLIPIHDNSGLEKAIRARDHVIDEQREIIRNLQN